MCRFLSRPHTCSVTKPFWTSGIKGKTMIDKFTSSCPVQHVESTLPNIWFYNKHFLEVTLMQNAMQISEINYMTPTRAAT